MNSELEKIISQVLGEKDSSESVKTTTVSLHISQMQEWGVRGGHIQFKAVQDVNNTRKDFINRLIEDNRIKTRLNHIMASLSGRGEILWLCLIDKNGKYKINDYAGGMHNPSPEYEVFYSDEPTSKGDIECVAVIDEVADRNSSSMNVYMQNDKIQNYQKKIYYISFIDKQKTVRFRVDVKPLDLNSFYTFYKSFLNSGNTSGWIYPPVVLPNVFPDEFPFVICKNIEQKVNKPGVDDFTLHRGLIEEHNELLMTASENLYIYNTPTLVTSRSADVVVDSANSTQDLINNTWAGQQGYKSPLQSRDSNPFRMPRVFGNVKEGERFGYVQSPDAVSGDQNLYIRQLRELIHWILGGVDPLGISSSATFGEIKSLFGRIENTASKKAECLLGNLCIILSNIIKLEESKAKIAIAQTLIAEQNVLFPIDQISKALTDEDFRNLYFYYQQIGVNIPGLVPLGNPVCSWKYSKAVFQNTTREKLDESIIYRNEREDGISQQVALSRLYPDMSDDEIRQMMSGFSPRVVQDDMVGIQGMLQLYTALMQVPDPETGVPWAIKLELNKLVEQSILTLKTELQYNIPNFKEDTSISDGQINELLTKLLTNAKLPTIATTVSSSPAANTAQSDRASRSVNRPTR